MEKFTASEVRSTIAANRDGVTDRKMEMLHAYADRLEADEKAVPVAYALFTEKGLIRMWSRDWFADAHGAPVKPTPLYAHPAPADAEGLAEAVRNGLIDALRHQRQIDEDGEEVGVSRQAIDEAAAILSALAAHSAQAQPQDIRCQRNSPAGCGCTTTCLALAQPAARTCSDERPCVNCFADQGGCLGPAPETVRQRKEQRAIEIAAAISTRHEFSRYESPLILGIVRATLAAQENPNV